MMSMFNRSPETTYCGLSIFLGLMMILLGALLPLSPSLQEKIVLGGLVIANGAAGILALLARSERQHEKDQPVLKRDIKEEIKPSVVAAVKEDLREVAAQEVKAANEERRGFR